MTDPHLNQILESLSNREATAMVAMRRIASKGLNAALLRRLSEKPGQTDSLIADPIFEISRAWKPADQTFDDLSGNLLDSRLVDALDGASAERMKREWSPYQHQLQAWKAAKEGLSCLVSSGTGSGKTECFMVPMIDDLLREDVHGKLKGVRAIVVYPLNALIESQRERLAAWTAPLKDRVSFALYNGLTPGTARKVDQAKLAPAEIGDRKNIRSTPPSILVTNVTMLEYMLMRFADQPILKQSQGLLRWIVLDEAHSYVGAQAAEMALLLRRVRAAFGVKPEDVRLMATSATISEGEDTKEKLASFVSDLAGVPQDRTRVIEGEAIDAELPSPGADVPFDPAALQAAPPSELWSMLAPHPRIHELKQQMLSGGVTFSDIKKTMGLDQTEVAQSVLFSAAKAENLDGEKLLPWRSHLFHRAQGGIWACIDPNCPHKDAELNQEESGWSYGAIHLFQRDHCTCGAPVFEALACSDCGTPHLVAGIEQSGGDLRLIPFRQTEIDDYAVDIEPEQDGAEETLTDRVWLAASPDLGASYVSVPKGEVFDNAAPDNKRSVQLRLYDSSTDRGCCASSQNARLMPFRFGPPFLMANSLPELAESLAPPLQTSGVPMGGRRAITFSDSRKGVAQLAAKLQQESERNLTRAFLYHAVQEGGGLDPELKAQLEKKLAKYLALPEPDDFADEIADLKSQLSDQAKPVGWRKLIKRFSDQSELRNFAAEVWRPRRFGGSQMADDPSKLAEMFLFRELFRRPRVQNSIETMGLARLAFPELEDRCRSNVPSALQEVGVTAEGWTGLALAAIDFVFRDNFAVNVESDEFARWINPRQPGRRSVFSPEARELGVAEKSPYFWPDPEPRSAQGSRFQRLVYGTIGGDWTNAADIDRAREVLDALWSLIKSTAARDTGAGAWRLDFERAALMRVETAWLCPVTRRLFGYAPGQQVSPYDPAREMTPVVMPRIPEANAGGVTPEVRAQLREWTEGDETVRSLRERALWTDLHDRVSYYAPFYRAQEHSAQIPRQLLSEFEEEFKEGKINLLNCSTTMEMGVDIPNVQLVVNSNVPPSISNYRQRVGRAGRRGEPWAFAATFCRDLPLDRITFENPKRLLEAPIAAPAVRLDSPIVVGRHVNAALLAGFLRERMAGINVRSTVGDFFGATEDPDKPVEPDAPADVFLDALRGAWSSEDVAKVAMGNLTRGTVFDQVSIEELAAQAANAFEELLNQWRAEHAEILMRASLSNDPEASKSLNLKAKKMAGQFLLSVLSQRGFTPAYGFPVDVVTFDHITGQTGPAETVNSEITDRLGGASRTLDIAIREYAPGAEVVINGLVHKSEGILPAWQSSTDASGIEDLGIHWHCATCNEFGLSKTSFPETCPECGASNLNWFRSLRPSGFIGRQRPHTGYESLGFVPSDMPKVSASGEPWVSLPDPDAGRIRVNSSGRLLTLGSGLDGHGYAVCLACGRAESETGEEEGNPWPTAMKGHNPLAPVQDADLQGGRCPGGDPAAGRVQRNVRFIHDAATDVFELQLPRGAKSGEALAVAAALREALTRKLGTESREIGVACSRTRGPSDDPRATAVLFDHAAGGAGLSSRLAEADWLSDVLLQAAIILDCSADCDNGCPACVLRPDINFIGDKLDRRAGLEVMRSLMKKLRLPDELRVFGPQTSVVGLPVADWIERQRRSRKLSDLTVFLHSDVKNDAWDLDVWSLQQVLVRISQDGIRPRLVLQSKALLGGGFDLNQALCLHRFSTFADIMHLQTMPMIGGTPIIACISSSDEGIAIAATDSLASIPGENWGLGETSPCLKGPAPQISDPQSLSTSSLLQQMSGNAKVVEIKSKLDGPVAEFGSGFWQLLRQSDVLTFAKIQSSGVKSIAYRDRYLLTPLALRLFAEVFRAMPGTTGKSVKVSIESSHVGPSARNAYSVFDAFPDDGVRSDVISEIFPGATVKIKPKRELPHERQMVLTLENERQLIINFDQGFGAWQVVSKPRHRFDGRPSEQAASLLNLSASVTIREGQNGTVIIRSVAGVV